MVGRSRKDQPSGNLDVIFGHSNDHGSSLSDRFFNILRVIIQFLFYIARTIFFSVKKVITFKEGDVKSGEKSNYRSRVISGLVMVAIVLVVIFSGSDAFNIVLISLSVALAFEWSYLINNNTPNRTLTLKKMYVIGFFYVAAPAISLYLIRNSVFGSEKLLIWYLIVVWSVDIGAYYVGRSFGGAKMFPLISPGKTWSGFFGGAITAAIISTLFYLIFAEETMQYDIFMAITLLISILAQISDLMESYIKRIYGVKDSSNLIPGHGGLMDRLDSLTLTAPCLAVIAAVYNSRFGEVFL